jgi:hypothetical protein
MEPDVIDDGDRNHSGNCCDGVKDVPSKGRSYGGREPVSDRCHASGCLRG